MRHELFPCTHVFVLTFFEYSHFLLSADHLLSYHPVLPPAHQLHLPGCGGQIPCALANEDLGTLAEYDPLTKEKSVPKPLEYIDVVRRTNTTLDVLLARRLDDYLLEC